MNPQSATVVTGCNDGEDAQFEVVEACKARAESEAVGAIAAVFGVVGEKMRPSSALKAGLSQWSMRSKAAP